MENEDILLGVVSKAVAEQWEIPEQEGKPIIKGKNWIHTHGKKHKYEFKSEFSFNETVKNLKGIIKKPSYVFYNKEEKGLEFYKKVVEDVTVVVRVTGKKKLYLATIYPSSCTKVQNRKIKEVEIMDSDIIEKYSYKGNWS